MASGKLKQPLSYLLKHFLHKLQVQEKTKSSLDLPLVRVQTIKGLMTKTTGRFRESHENIRSKDSLHRVTARIRVVPERVTGGTQSRTRIKTKEAPMMNLIPVSILQKVSMFPNENHLFEQKAVIPPELIIPWTILKSLSIINTE